MTAQLPSIPRWFIPKWKQPWRNGFNNQPEIEMRVEVLCQRTGWSQTRVRARLRELLAAGNIECVRIPYRNISGNLSRVPAYRVIRRDDVE